MRFAAVAALVLTVVMTAVGAVLWQASYSHQPLWVEHAAYGMWSNVTFHEDVVRDGYWQAVRQAITGGARHPLQPALLGLVSRRLLSWPHSHLIVTAGALYVFLLLLIRFATERAGRVYAVGVAVLFCTFAGLYDERTGIGVPWPDYQSMLFLSSAALSLGIFAAAPPATSRQPWLVVAGVCAALAALARDTGAAYAVVVCLPIVAVLTLVEAVRAKSVARGALTALAFAVPALPIAYMLAHKLAFFRQYYLTSNAWQLRHSFQESVVDISRQLWLFCGPLSIVAMGVLLLATLVRPRRGWSAADVVVICWPVSFFLLLLFNGYTGNWAKEVMYISPGVLCMAATLRGGFDFRRRAFQIVAAIVLVLAVSGARHAATDAYVRAETADERAQSIRDSQQAVARALATIPDRVVWQSYSSYDWGTPIAALTLFEFDRYQPTENRWFFNKKAYWDASFPNLTLQQLGEHISAQANQYVDAAIVLKDPNQLPEDMEEYSFQVAAAVSRHISAAPQWQHYRDLDTFAGPLSIYLNSARLTARR